MRGFFKETQKFTQWWLWGIVLVTTVACVVPLMYGMFKQFIAGEPWGDTPMPDTALILVFSFTILLMGGIIWFLFSIELRVEVHDRAIYYSFYPIIVRNRRIGVDEIESWEVRKYSAVGEFGGYGIRKTLGGKTAYNIKGNQGLTLKLKSGKTILLGTQKPVELRAAVQYEYDKLHDPTFE